MSMPYSTIVQKSRAVQREPASAESIADSETRVIGLPWAPFAATTAFRLGRRQALRDAISSLPLAFVDVAAVLIAIGLANFVAQGMGLDAKLSPPVFVFVAVGLTLMLQAMHGLYPACGLPYSVEYERLLRTSLLVVASMAGGLALQLPWRDFPIVEFSVFSIAVFLGLTSLRSLARQWLSQCDWWTQPVVLIGDTAQTRALYKRLDRGRSEGLRPVGVLYDPEVHWAEGEKPDRGMNIGPIGDLESVLLRSGVCRVAVSDTLPIDGQAYHHFQGVPHVMLATDLGRQPTERVLLFEHEGRVELNCHSKLTCPVARLTKCSMDLVMVLLAAPVWLPVMITISLAIKVSDPGPLFFRQHRVGRFGRPFYAIKFRSMVCQADSKLNEYLAAHPELRAEWQATHKLKHDPRVTWIGSFLRKSSLDELPQLLNVLRGEMSLVGPRPIIDCGDYDRIYIDEHPEVFELYQMVRPGITGLWQISGRNSLPYKQRVLLDRVYLHNWSLALDIFILWRTLKTALFREGAY